MVFNLRFFWLFLFVTTINIPANSQRYDKSDTKRYAALKNSRILVFTKNGKGYVHQNIPASIAAFQKLGNEYGCTIDTSADASVFTDENLQKYDVVVFSNTNNNVFDHEHQKVAFMRYIQAGGGFMGIHSASGTERNWTWFKLMLGASFLRHPPFQPFTVRIIDKLHPATKNLPITWATSDECYYFKEINPKINILAVADISTIVESNESGTADSIASKQVKKPDVFGNSYPAVWCNEFDGGKIWYTALGHSKDDYANSTYIAHIVEGLKWLVDKKKPDYKKAYATRSDINGWDLLQK